MDVYDNMYNWVVKQFIYITRKLHFTFPHNAKVQLFVYLLQLLHSDDLLPWKFHIAWVFQFMDIIFIAWKSEIALIHNCDKFVINHKYKYKQKNKIYLLTFFIWEIFYGVFSVKVCDQKIFLLGEINWENSPNIRFNIKALTWNKEKKC